MGKVEKVIVQSTKWIKFGIISPLVYFAVAIGLNYLGWIDISDTVVVGLLITGVVCFIWWFWALRVIIELASMNQKATKDLTNTISSIRIVRKEVNETTTEMRKMIEELKKK